MIEKPQDNHWLARPGTIRKLWIALIAFLALLLAGGAVCSKLQNDLLLRLLEFGHVRDASHFFSQRFDFAGEPSNIRVFWPVYPAQADKFRLHRLVSFGRGRNPIPVYTGWRIGIHLAQLRFDVDLPLLGGLHLAPHLDQLLIGALKQPQIHGKLIRQAASVALLESGKFCFQIGY